MSRRNLRSDLRIESLEDRNLLTLAVALTTTNELLVFDTFNPGQVFSRLAITGLRSGEMVLGIDYRPVDGRLYAVSNNDRLLILNPENGAATAVGSGFSTPLEGGKVSIDFNPVVDRLRIVTDSGQNLRVNPDTGAIAAVDTPVAYGIHDPFFGSPPNVVGVAYVNNFVGAPDTWLFGIDFNLGNIVIQDPPNDGVLGTVAPLPVNTSSNVGFDIFQDAIAYALFSVGPTEEPRLYWLDVLTGEGHLLGTIGTDRLVLDLAINIYDFGLAPAGQSEPGADVVTGLLLDQAMATPLAAPVASPLAVERALVSIAAPVAVAHGLVEALTAAQVDRGDVDDLFVSGLALGAVETVFA